MYQGRPESITARAELELKLRIDHKAIDSLHRLNFLIAHSIGFEPPKQLRSIYFDTADHALIERGLTLRVREIDVGAFLQTLKRRAEEDGSSFARTEWETRSSHPRPDTQVLRELDLDEKLRSITDADLIPIFETVVTREVVLVEWPGLEEPPTRIEVALDRGFVAAGRERQKIAEIELELIEGSATSLFALARALCEILPCELGTMAKSARGWQLAAGRCPASRKPPKSQLAHDLASEKAMQTILRQCLGHWLHHESIAQDGHDPEGLHQLRVAIRMVRSALTIFRPLITDAVGRALNERLRTLQGRLSAARDLDVMALELVAPLRARPDLAASIPPLDARLERARRKARKGVRQAIASREYRVVVLDLLFWIELGRWREGARAEVVEQLGRPARELAIDILGRRWRKVLKVGKNLEDRTEEERHAARIALKKVRYGLNFFGSLFDDSKPRRFVNRVAQLQDILGALNDSVVVRQQLMPLANSDGTQRRRAELSLAAGLVIGWHASASLALLQRAASLLEAISVTKPPWEGQ